MPAARFAIPSRYRQPDDPRPLDRDVDWTEIGDLVEDPYRVIAPAKLAFLEG